MFRKVNRNNQNRFKKIKMNKTHNYKAEKHRK